MVAKITVPSSIKRALNYNEQKLKEGKAECIYAHNFLREAQQLNFYDKLQRFEDLIALNKRAATNTVHISLNFAVTEKLERQKLIEIANVYMQKIGFGDQPYLVYRHLDAGHPHMHIVTTNIRADGKRISLHNLGRNESAKARKEIETAYYLVAAEKLQEQSNEIKPLTAQRVQYGKSPTKRGITNVLDSVLLNYKYSSLAELNAILRQYNLMADRGKENGIIYQKKGLVYRVLDEKGNKIGVPIKASSLYSKPTLPFLEGKFKENEALKQEHKKHLRTVIDWILVKSPKSIQHFKLALEKEKIHLVIRKNEQGVIYGLTYIDHNTKCVFNGSDIGKQYSAKEIFEKCGITHSMQESANTNELTGMQGQVNEISNQLTQSKIQELSKIIEEVIKPDEGCHYLPQELKKKWRRRRKRNP